MSDLFFFQRKIIKLYHSIRAQAARQTGKYRERNVLTSFYVRGTIPGWREVFYRFCSTLPTPECTPQHNH